MTIRPTTAMSALALATVLIMAGCAAIQPAVDQATTQGRQAADAILRNTERAYLDLPAMGAVTRRCSADPAWCRRYLSLHPGVAQAIGSKP